MFRKCGRYNQRFAGAQSEAEEVNKLGRAVADQNLRRFHPMMLCQSLFEFLSIRVGIAQHLVVTFLKSLAGGSRRSQGIDAGAEIDDLRRINARSLSPSIDISTMLAVQSLSYNRTIEISTNVTSERMAVIRHRDRASFNISILTGVRSSPIVGFQISVPK